MGGATLEEEQQLIRTGQMTPFGTSVGRLPASDAGISAESAATVGDRTLMESDENTSDYCTVSRSVGSEGKPLRQARIPKKKPEAIPETSHASVLADVAVPSQSNSGSLEPSFENGFGPDDWVPSLADLLDSSSASSAESEYYTDEELGGTKKKKKKLRELSSDGLSEEEEWETRPRKGGVRKGGRKGKRKTVAASQRRYNDDGDEELYLQRLW